jgi:hypothetical protein
MAKVCEGCVIVGLAVVAVVVVVALTGLTALEGASRDADKRDGYLFWSPFNPMLTDGYLASVAHRLALIRSFWWLWIPRYLGTFTST